MQAAQEKGVRGLKFWKDLGLERKDSQGRFIAVDDQRLRVIWATATELGLPVLIYAADPVAFFKSLGPTNERYEELVRYPE